MEQVALEQPQLLVPELIGRSNITVALETALRCFTKANDQKLLALDFWSFARGGRETFDALLQSEVQLEGYYLFYSNHRPVGTVGMYRTVRDQQTLWMSWLGVILELRGQGYADQIIEFVKSRAASTGAVRLACYASREEGDKAVHSFYHRLGFKMGEQREHRGEKLQEFRYVIPL